MNVPSPAPSTSQDSAELRLRAENAKLRDEVQTLRSSLRFRAATEVARMFSSPSAFIKGPGRLWSLSRELRTIQAWRKLVVTLECGLPDDPLRHLSPSTSSITDIRSLIRAAQSPIRPSKVGFRSAEPEILRAKDRLTELSAMYETGPDWPEPAMISSNAEASRRVLMALHTGAPDQSNGYARRSHELLKALNGLGWDVAGALRLPASAVPNSEKVEPFYQRIDPVNPEGDGLEAYVHAYADSLYKAIERVQPALVHAASNHITGRAAAIAAKRAGLPFIYEVRGLWEVTRASVEPAYRHSVGYQAQRRLELETAKAADRLLVNGETLADVFIESGVDRHRIVNVPNGISEQFTPSPETAEALKAEWGLDNRPIIGFVGSITSYEGLTNLVSACAELKDLPFQLLIVGDGPDMSTLVSEVQRRKLDGRTCFTGRVTPDIAQLAYQFTDIAPIVRSDTPVSRLVPPLKPLDAMAGRAALIVSDLPPLMEFAADGRALSVPSGSRNELVKALRSLLQDEALRSRLTETAHSWVTETRSWDKIASNIADVYSDLTGKQA